MICLFGIEKRRHLHADGVGGEMPQFIRQSWRRRPGWYQHLLQIIQNEPLGALESSWRRSVFSEEVAILTSTFRNRLVDLGCIFGATGFWRGSKITHLLRKVNIELQKLMPMRGVSKTHEVRIENRCPMWRSKRLKSSWSIILLFNNKSFTIS